MAKSIAVRNLQVGDEVKVPDAILTTWLRVTAIEVTDVYTVRTENPMDTFQVPLKGRVTVIRRE